MAAKNPKHKHTWKWAYADNEDRGCRTVYDESEAEVACDKPGCYARVPGEDFIAIVRQLRETHLSKGEDEHANELQRRLDVIAHDT